MRPEVKNAIFITATWHLVVIIVLLLVSISFEIFPDKGILLDFSKEDEKEKEEKIKEEADKLLEKHLIEAGILSSLAVNNDPLLEDDRFSAEENRQLYSDMARIDAERLRAGETDNRDALLIDNPVPMQENGNDEDAVEYHGPSVAYYTLTGRRAVHLVIPAYKCINQGEVMVAIYVDRSGKVCEAFIMENGSSTDECIREQALSAALNSVFNAKENAPEIQYGDIRYIFIAQER